MNRSLELKALLERLKGEIVPDRPEFPYYERPGRGIRERETPPPGRAERFFGRMYSEKPVADIPRRAHPANTIWSENKEAMLFGVLASLITVLAGIISGLDYLTFIGAMVFVLFSFVMAMTLFGYYLSLRKKRPEDDDLSARLDYLSRKVETLSNRRLSAAYPVRSDGGSYAGNRALENKVEELRVLIKTLSKAVGWRGRDGREEEGGAERDEE